MYLSLVFTFNEELMKIFTGLTFVMLERKLKDRLLFYNQLRLATHRNVNL